MDRVVRGVPAWGWWLVLVGLATWGPGGAVHAEEAYELPVPAALKGVSAPLRGAWLVRHQRADGSWSARDYDLTSLGVPVQRPRRDPGRGTADHDLTCTALATASLDVGGYTMDAPSRRFDLLAASRGFRWLLARQRPDGAFHGAGDPAPLHASAHASWAVLQHFRLWRDQRLREPAQRAVRFLLGTQSGRGAWQTHRRDDPLLTLWAVLALHEAVQIDNRREAAKQTRLFPAELDDAIERAAAWYIRRTDPRTGAVPVRKGDRTADGASTPMLTAAGVLVRCLAVQLPRDDETLALADARLATMTPTVEGEGPRADPLFAWIGARAATAARGAAANAWLDAFQQGFVRAQHDAGGGDMHGSWDPRGVWGRSRGRVAATAVSGLALQDIGWIALIEAQARLGAAMSYLDGAPAPGAMAPPEITPTIEAGGPVTWVRSALPTHAARLTLAEGGALPLDAAHVRAAVHGHRAQVVLDLFVTNTERDLREGVLDLRLPDGASPYYLAFGTAALARVPAPETAAGFATELADLRTRQEGEWGLLREARMAPVKRATEAFESIVRRRKDPALLTWRGAGVYHLRVFPLEPGKQHRIVLAYDVDLSLVGDDAELRLGVPQDIPEVRVALQARDARVDVEPDATDAAGVRSWRNPGAEVIHVRVSAEGNRWIVGPDADGRPHTAAWLRPEVPRIERAARPHACFLVDVSRDVHADQLNAWRMLIPAILEANRDRIRAFRVGFFDMRTRWWREGPTPNTPEQVDALVEALGALEPGGATDLAAALRSVPAADAPTDVFLFSDGRATWGARDRAAILAAAPKGMAVFPHAVGIGSDERGLLQALADHSGGALVSVHGPSEVQAAARATRHEAWTLQAIHVPGLSDLLLSGDPRQVHPGQRLRLGGRGTPASGAQVFLRLVRDGAERTLRVPVERPEPAPGVERIYGVEGVERLEEVGGEPLARVALDYAMHYRVVRRGCALLMLETEAQYKQFGLDTTGHGRRAWARPVLQVLGPQHEALTPAPPGPAAIAATRWVPKQLLDVLPRGIDPAHAVRRPLPADDDIRRLGGRFEGTPEDPDRRELALLLLGAGRPGHALEVLAPYLTAVPQQTDRGALWLAARAAAEAGRIPLALVAYEGALGGEWPQGGLELWVIAADYARWLRRAETGRLSAALRAFMAARSRSLEVWRRSLGVLAPPAEASLVVLHATADPRDRSTLQLDGLDGHAVDLRSWHRAPQALIVEPAPTRHWALRIVRAAAEPPAGTRIRSFVVVIRDWGRANERVAWRGVVGPVGDEVLHRGR